MSAFKVILDNKDYEIQSVQSNGKNERSYEISTSFGSVRASIRIPIEEKLTRAKVMLFIEAFHEAMKVAIKAQDISQNYILNQGNTIS